MFLSSASVAILEKFLTKDFPKQNRKQETKITTVSLAGGNFIVKVNHIANNAYHQKNKLKKGSL